MKTNAPTAEGLGDADQERLLRAAPGFRSPDGWFADMDPYGITLLFLRVGVHPIVPARAVEHRLRIELRDDGLPRAVWDRPKKKGVSAWTSVELEPSDLEWANPTIEWVRANPRSTVTYRRFFHQLGEFAGCTHPCSPRVMRHTFATNLAREVRDPEIIMRKLNCSLRTAAMYLKGASYDRDRAVAVNLFPVPRPKWEPRKSF